MSVDFITVSDRLSEIDGLIQEALRAVDADGGASPVLVAVVQEFQNKSKKALGDLDEAEEESVREHIIELEQAGDCAKVAAEADENINESTREVVINAHEAICALKDETAD